MENKDIVIIDKVRDIEIRSGVSFELDITEVVSLAERAKAITSVQDPNFYTIKKECQQKRKYISEYFYDARAEFNKLSKGVIEVEKMVLAEFTPEEDRLIALDKAEKERVLREERLAALPAKKDRLAVIGIEFTDEKILSMTDADFEIELSQAITAKTLVAQAAAESKLAEERAAFEAEKAELARKQAEADRIEAARVEERRKAEEALRLQKEEAERKEKEAEDRRKAEDEERRLRLEREEKERKDRIEREAKEKADAEIEAKRAAQEAEAKRAADEKWQNFLKENNYNNETDVLLPDVDGMIIYRFVAKFKN